MLTLKFRLGDRVRHTGTNLLGTIDEIDYLSGDYNYLVDWDQEEANWENERFLTDAPINVSDSTNWGPLSTLKSNNMNIKEKFTNLFLQEPEKTFRKAGITNGDGYLTDDGVRVFLTWLLKQHGEKFKTEVVDELVKEDK